MFDCYIRDILLWLDAQKMARKDELKKAAKKQGQEMPNMQILQAPVARRLKSTKLKMGC
jgi:hypothetical protein